MRKIISILIICILLSAGGYPADAELEDGVTIIDERYKLNKYRDDDDGPLFLARYRNDSCTVEELHLSINEYMNFSDGNGIEKGSGKNGVFMVKSGWYNAGAGVNIIDTYDKKINTTNLFFPLDDWEGLRYDFEYPEDTRLLVNSVTAVRTGNRLWHFFYRDGTPFDIDFNYGKKIYIKKYNWNHAQYYPINLEYSFAREQYAVMYTRSPFSNTKEGGVKRDTTKCAVSMAVFDKNGQQVKQFPLEGLYYFDSIQIYHDPIKRLEAFHTPVYFTEEEPNKLYISGLIGLEDVREEGFYLPPSWDEEIEILNVKVDLDNETYEFISQKQFDKNIKKPNYPFIIEKHENETRLISKATKKLLTVMNGDYIPVDYSDNTDGSFEMIFALEKAV